MSASTRHELTEDDFLVRFTPVPNPIDPDAGFDGCLFETFGDELAYVRAQDFNLVWTVLDCDDQLSIASGFHFVNRLGYLIASVPVAPDHTYSVACEDLTEAASCGFTDDEMSWLEDARKAIAKAKGGAP